jgi:hypothetical protein
MKNDSAFAIYFIQIAQKYPLLRNCSLKEYSKRCDKLSMEEYSRRF